MIEILRNFDAKRSNKCKASTWNEEMVAGSQDAKDIDEKKYFKSGKHYYKRESREWGFRIK